MANGTFGGGNGTLVSPYLVEDAADLLAVSTSPDLHYHQVADIDLASVSNFPPISQGSTGFYNGGGYLIKNLTIDTSASSVGLFGDLYGTVWNVHIRNGSVTNTSTASISTGGFAGRLYNGVRDCSYEGDVKSYGSSGNVGGFAGDIYRAYVTKRCYSSGTVSTLSTGNNSPAGGFVGYVDAGTTENCYSSSNVYGRQKVGGFAGSSATHLAIRSYSSGFVEGTDYVAGFIGSASPSLTSVSNCYSLSPYIKRVSGTGSWFSRFLNSTSGIETRITNCYALSTMEFRGS